MSIETDLESLTDLAGLIDTTVVDGIPTLLAAREGPVTGGLMFRVGRADETLATSGITHLVEHLALFPLNMSDVHHNGQTGDGHTLFHATGTVAEVVDFLDGVCASLRDLPLDRLEVEKAVLRTEAAQAGGQAFKAMRVWRYGAQGPGLAGSAEAGLPLLTADAVAAWVSTRFTRDNAVLFLTAGALPSGLSLELPGGRRFPVEVPTEALLHKPAWFRGAQGGIAVDGVVQRTSASSLFARTAERTLFRVLRQERGLSYTVTCDYEPITSDLARIAAYADALTEKQDAVARTMVATLGALRDDGVDEADLAAARKLLRQQFDVADLGAALLPNVALDVLIGRRTRHPDELRDELDAVTVEDLAAVAQAFWDDALAQVPGEGLDWAGFAPAPMFSTEEVSGRVFPRYADPDIALVIGDEGVTLRTSDGVVTVRFEDCVLMSAVPDGGRVLIGRDGFQVVIEPTLHRRLNPKMVAAMIDPHVPRNLVKDLPTRPAEQIPRPSRFRKDFRVAPEWRGLGQWAQQLGIFLTTLGAVGLLSFLPMDAASSPSDNAGLGAMRIVSVLITLGGVFLIFGATRRRAL